MNPRRAFGEQQRDVPMIDDPISGSSPWRETARTSGRPELDLRAGERIDGIDDSLIAAEGLRQFAELSPTAIAIVDGSTQIIRFANRSFSRLRHVKKLEHEPTVGRAIACAFPPAAAELIAKSLEQVYRTGEPQREFELDYTGGDGEYVWGVSIWPIGDGFDQLALEVRDVTEERRRWSEVLEEVREVNERLLRAALREEDLRERAEAASQAKSQFLAIMSHELRTPLTAIIGYEELLSCEVSGPLNEQQHVQMDRIKKSAEHLLALINEVLTVSRIEARSDQVRWQTIELDALLDEATTIVAPLAASKGLAYTVHRPEEPVTFISDPLKVRQILVNLLGNAVKFTDRGAITLNARVEADALFFEVQDTGIGIQSTHLPRVFDPFWQADQTATRDREGSGLGLSVSRRLAQFLGGDVTVESILGQGSTFALRLPLQETAAQRG